MYTCAGESGGEDEQEERKRGEKTGVLLDKRATDMRVWEKMTKKGGRKERERGKKGERQEEEHAEHMQGRGRNGEERKKTRNSA